MAKTNKTTKPQSKAKKKSNFWGTTFEKINIPDVVSFLTELSSYKNETFGYIQSIAVDLKEKILNSLETIFPEKIYILTRDEVVINHEDTLELLEINSLTKRLDLKDIHVKSAIRAGVKLVINTDSHSIEQLQNINLGIGTARRGWAKKEDVANTRSLKDFLKMIK